MTGDVASAVGSTASGVATVTRAVADVATSPAVQEVALESQGNIAKQIVKQALK
jgi:C4-dicarboxylate transporter